MKNTLFTLVLASLLAMNAQAKIWIPSVFSDNMVLQQQSDAMLWGWTSRSAEELTIEASWLDQPLKVKAFQGKWSVELPTPEAGGPFTITIRGHEEIELRNVMIGEVWLLSGQSNMQWSARSGILNAEEEIRAANQPGIRLFQVPHHRADFAQEDSYGTWEVCTPETMETFSAIGYFFARQLQEQLNVPVGLIGSYWGGTSVETWIPKELIEASEELSQSARSLAQPACCPQQAVGELYNAMIHPLINYNIAGVLWYQGESNRQNPETYDTTFPMLIRSWRDAWQADFPFYFAQIAPFRYTNDSAVAAALVQEAQLKTMLKVPNTGMVVTNDIANLEDIHPKNKQEAGRRLALWALARSYGMKDLVHSGPVYREMEVDGNRIILHFDHTGSGLEARDGALREFYIAGEDKVFYPAKARIRGNSVEVRSAEVKNPVAVRFAFSDTAIHNLFNAEGLPASPFRTDDWEISTD